ncbi:MAG TPA: VCBS repeat-containing protein [Sphingobacteriaceae bacterium]|nr:VCBS repeat-containing protein [Sphingobacteriaceae bacterium]
MFKNFIKSVYLIIFILIGVYCFSGCRILKPVKNNEITFRDYTKESGLYELVKGLNGHSVATGDINNDGYPDLFIGTFTNHADSAYNHLGHPGYPEPDKLFINNKGKGFTEVSPSPTEVKGVSSGAAFADFDNDGHLDLISSHLSNYGRKLKKDNPKKNNYLFKNDGTGNMTDVTANSNLIFDQDSVSGRNTFVLDYDGDGLLDLLMQEDDVWEWSVGRSKLMRNKGNMVFEDVTQKAGLPLHFHGLGGFVGDVNGDTWPDIFFAHSSEMYINNQNGTFRKLPPQFTDEKNKVIRKEGNYNWTCGANTGDLNGDGLIDFVMGEHFKKEEIHRISVFINKGNDASGNPVFENVTDKVGIKNASSKQPHVEIEDLDNDGDMDIQVSSRDDFFYTNTGTDKSNLPIFTGPGKSNAPTKGLNYWPAASLFDFDRDGLLDFVGAQWYAYEISPLLKNVTPNAKDYITLRLDIASEKNRNGIGGIVKIYKPGKAGVKKDLLGIKVVSISNGYSSGTTSDVHFGTPGFKKVDVIIDMPGGGNRYKISKVPTRQYFKITDEVIKRIATR